MQHLASNMGLPHSFASPVVRPRYLHGSHVNTHVLSHGQDKAAVPISSSEPKDVYALLSNETSPVHLIVGQQASAGTSAAMQFHGETVLDAPLAFLDEIEMLPELPDTPNGFGAPLIDPTEEILSDLLGTDDPHETSVPNPKSPVIGAAVSVQSASEYTNKSHKKISQAVGTDLKAVRRREIEYLRAQVRELEGELSRLQTSILPLTETTVWEDIARRQRRVRKRAEVENARLRQLYQRQLDVARSLAKLLEKGRNDMLSEWGNVKRRPVLEACENSEQIFQTIRTNLAGRPTLADKWMEESGLAPVKHNFDRAYVRCGSENDIFLEMLLCRRFPFPFEATCDAVWNNLSADHLELENGVYDIVERSETHFLGRSKMGLMLPRLDSSLEFYVVGQRFIEDYRMVVVTEFHSITRSEAFQTKRECLNESGYIVVERDQSNPLHSSIVRSCKRSWPQLDEWDGENGSWSRFQVLAAILIDICNSNCRTMFQHAENSLLDASSPLH